MLNRHFALGAALGGFVTVFVYLQLAGMTLATILSSILMLAVTALFPLARWLLEDPSSPRRTWVERIVALGYPLAIPATIAALCFSPGRIAFGLSLPWLLITLLISGQGLQRLLENGVSRLEEMCLDIGRVFLGIGGAWFAASRFGGDTVFGFSEPIITLTAIHFHYAGFFTSLMVGWRGRELSSANRLARPLWKLAALGTLIGVPLLAAGISLSPGIESAAALVLAGSVCLYAVLVLTALFDRPSKIGSILLAISSLSAFYSMGWAARYGWHRSSPIPGPDIGTMILRHGVLNAFIFAGWGILGWFLTRPAARRTSRPLPFSRLRGRGRTIGPDFFEREKIVDPKRPVPTGLIDNLDQYRNAQFDPQRVHPAVRAFYERTQDFDLTVTAHWSAGFRNISRAYRKISQAVGQMNLPSVETPSESGVHSRLFALSDSRDGRTNVRAWVRTYIDSGKAVYVAAYSSIRSGDATFMNIAFPLPFGQLTSILRVETFRDDGLLLTSQSTQDFSGDEGVYLVSSLASLRLPMNETIEVWPENNVVRAEHRVWLLGYQILSLDYTIQKQS
jgi:hypothetical protein